MGGYYRFVQWQSLSRVLSLLMIFNKSDLVIVVSIDFVSRFERKKLREGKVFWNWIILGLNIATVQSSWGKWFDSIWSLQLTRDLAATLITNTIFLKKFFHFFCNISRQWTHFHEVFCSITRHIGNVLATIEEDQRFWKYLVKLNFHKCSVL